MLLLVGYLIVNMIISVLLDRSHGNYKVARVLHAVVFSAVLCVLIISQSGVVSSIMADAMGKDYYRLLYEMITYTQADVISPLMVVEILVPLLAVLVTTIFAVRVVKYIRTKRAPYPKRLSSHKKQLIPVSAESGYVHRIYIQNCVLRC